MRFPKAAVCAAVLCPIISTGEASAKCVNIFHDEIAAENSDRGPVHSVFIANLLGHWPEYEVRVRRISDYQRGEADNCEATLYVGTNNDAPIPQTFLVDFFRTEKRVAWIGFGAHHLSQVKLEQTFGYRTKELIGRDEDSDEPLVGFYQYISYRGRTFRKDVFTEDGTQQGEFSAVRYERTSNSGTDKVVARLIHNKTFETVPYVLRSGSKFLIADIPTTYMHEGGRYFAFADLLFDILDEKPLRTTPLAFARVEDIHGVMDLDLLRSSLATLAAEDVPISIAHIPIFVDPRNSAGFGNHTKGTSASKVKSFAAVVSQLKRDSRNALIWHGVTHQFGEAKNPYSGASGDDYEFWDAASSKPILNESPAMWTARLKRGLAVFDEHGVAPRYWVTPHYQGSAMANKMFGQVFPWVIGRVTYYPTSVSASFTLPATRRDIGSALPAVAEDVLDRAGRLDAKKLDVRSEQGLGQLFPFEIYRDIYGQRIIPETLGYMSKQRTEQTNFIRTYASMLSDAHRNRIVRDYWASFFFHPYVFETSSGPVRFDTTELRALIIGLKELGYTFVSLPEFESGIRQANRSHETGVPPRKRSEAQEPASSLTERLPKEVRREVSWTR